MDDFKLKLSKPPAFYDPDIRLSELVEREDAKRKILKKLPGIFKWEVNKKTDSTTIPEWLIEAMIEFKNG
jgi:hypothetical protein